MTNRCKACGAKKTGSTDYCRTHKHEVRRLSKAAREAGHTVDVAGGAWWVWDAQGNVLGAGSSRLDALRGIWLEVEAA